MVTPTKTWELTCLNSQCKEVKVQRYTEKLEKYLEKLDKEKIECGNQIFSWQNELDDAKEMLDIIDENSPFVYWQKRRVLTAESIILNLKIRLEQIDLEKAELETQLKVMLPKANELLQER